MRTIFWIRRNLHNDIKIELLYLFFQEVNTLINMKKILNSIKKNLYIVVFLPIITNSLINLFRDQKFLYFTEPKVYIFLISFCFACILYSISIIIDNSLIVFKSLSITYFYWAISCSIIYFPSLNTLNLKLFLYSFNIMDLYNCFY